MGECVRPYGGATDGWDCFSRVYASRSWVLRCGDDSICHVGSDWGYERCGVAVRAVRWWDRRHTWGAVTNTGGSGSVVTSGSSQLRVTFSSGGAAFAGAGFGFSVAPSTLSEGAAQASVTDTVDQGSGGAVFGGGGLSESFRVGGAGVGSRSMSLSRWGRRVR